MKEIYRDENKICYADDIQVRTKYHSGGSITTLKHDISYHDFAKNIPKEGCIFCKHTQPERVKRSDTGDSEAVL